MPCKQQSDILTQVDDCIANMEEVLLKGVVVDVEAEEMKEEVVDSSVGIVGKTSSSELGGAATAKSREQRKA